MTNVAARRTRALVSQGCVAAGTESIFGGSEPRVDPCWADFASSSLRATAEGTCDECCVDFPKYVAVVVSTKKGGGRRYARAH